MTKKIVFIAHGTLGDYQPAAIVCRRVANQGNHECVWMAPTSVASMVDHPDVRFIDGGMGMEYARQNTPVGIKLGKAKWWNVNPIFMEWWTMLTEDWAPRVISMLQRERPDLVVLTIGSLLVLGPLIDAVGVKSISLLANPLHKTGEYTPTYGPQVAISLGSKMANRAFWSITNKINRLMAITILRRVLEKMGIRTLEFGKCRTRKIILCSSYLFPDPRDWKHHKAMVAGVVWPSLEKRVDTGIDAFIANGDGPVAYVGFGSMLGVYRTNAHRLALLRTCVDACLGRGMRVVVSTVGVDVDVGFQSERVWEVTGNVSHMWLFPKCDVIIHHGGSGTTHTALRAGKPQVIVPFFFPCWFMNGVEQHFWMAHVRRCGLGSGIRDVDGATPNNIRAAIRRAVRPMVVKYAAEMGMDMAMEKDGSDVAIRAINTALY